MGGNASGDCKLKPFFIHTAQNPRCFKNRVNAQHLPVIWAANKKAWMTATLFEQWFPQNFVPDVRQYCQRKGIPFKILLLVDNCTAHPNLNHIDPNVRVEFLPPNTTSIIQPMDQGVIATAKAIYKKITFTKAHETHKTLAAFLKDYDILQAVNNFANAWSQVTKKNMRAVWNPLLQRNENYESPVNEIIEEVVDLGQQIGLEDLSAEDINGSLAFAHR